MDSLSNRLSKFQLSLLSIQRQLFEIELKYNKVNKIKMLNGFLLAKPIEEETTQNGIILISDSHKSYKKLRVIHPDINNITKVDDVISVPKHVGIEYEENLIVNVKDILVID